MESKRNLARWAGLLYGIAASMAPFAYLYIPGRLIVADDALATMERVRSLEHLLRAAIFFELYGVTVLLFAAVALYRLFKDVDERLAMVMAAMMLVSIPISYVNALLNIAPLVLLKNPAIAAVLDADQIAAQMMLFLRLHNFGLVVNQILWGLWLIPIGILIMRSGFLPRWLGIPLFFAGGGYVLHSIGTLVLHPSQRWMTDSLQILGVGEIPFGLYFLIWGIRGYRADRLTAFLVVGLFVVGMASLVLLMTDRIDVHLYLAIKGLSLAGVVGLVLRWRVEGRSMPKIRLEPTASAVSGSY